MESEMKKRAMETTIECLKSDITEDRILSCFVSGFRETLNTTECFVSVIFYQGLTGTAFKILEGIVAKRDGRIFYIDSVNNRVVIKVVFKFDKVIF